MIHSKQAAFPGPPVRFGQAQRSEDSSIGCLSNLQPKVKSWQPAIVFVRTILLIQAMRKPPLPRVMVLVAAAWFGVVPASADHYLVYLIGGQSNANGRGDSAQLTEPLASLQKDVRFYWHRTQKAKNTGYLTEDQWIELAPGSGHGQTEPVYPKELGPEISFGRTLADAKPDKKIAIIKYSHGGSSLHGAWAAGGPMYKAFIATTQAALAALKEAGHTHELRGMIWQQGEADTYQKGPAAAYQANLTALIKRVRKDLCEGKPLPFSIGGLSDSQDASVKIPGKGWHTVRQAQETVAKTVPRTGFVNSDGFSTRPGEPIHFNHEGLIALGKAHAAEIIRLENDSASPASSDENRSKHD